MTVKVRKNIINQILGYINFCFEMRPHLVHLFAEIPKMVKINRWSCLENEPNTKLNHIFIV